MASKKTPKKPQLLWTRSDILFDGNEVLGAKPIQDGVAARAAQNAPPDAPTARERGPNDDYKVQELAREKGLSPAKIRDLFRNEPGVTKLKDENASRKRKRSYVSLRIPRAVADRVFKRLS
jgi:hypothetical protein